VKSTMMDVPLLISRILTFGSTVHAGSEVVTWTAEGPRRASYAEVGRECAQLAHALRGLGVTGDERVATFMWNNREHLEAYLAVPSMGAVLHTINIRLFPEQMVYVVNHAEDSVVIVDNSLAAPFAKLLAHAPSVQHVIVNGAVPPETAEALAASGRTIHSWADLLEGQPDTFDWPLLDENTGAARCYTSGTTGNPKGVVYSHRSNYLHSMQLAGGDGLTMRQGDRILAIVPLFHANAWGIPYAALMTGASLVMPDRFLQPAPLAEMIEAEKVTLAGAVPTIFSGLLAHLDGDSSADMSSLREVIIGGSACPPALMRAFQERHGVRVLHAWGMTEMSPLGTVAHPPADTVGTEREWAFRETQGRLAVSVEGRLVGPDGGVLAWDGESVGELQVRGPWIAGSYYRDDDPGKYDGGWLRTGDVGSLTADGYLRLTDRAKDVIKSGGEWISSVELENQLMGHPAVAEASVVGVPDEKWGERPLATVVVRTDEKVTARELRDYLADKVAHWQLPERWAFIAEVPKTSVGKFDKRQLRKAYAEGELEVTTLGSGG
jgi:fatty-acyl-CoA synthase